MQSRRLGRPISSFDSSFGASSLGGRSRSVTINEALESVRVASIAVSTLSIVPFYGRA